MGFWIAVLLMALVIMVVAVAQAVWPRKSDFDMSVFEDEDDLDD